jgi:hypothetical protein
MEELIRRFNKAGVRYLLIGGQAVRLEGVPRFSMDWDFYIPPHDEKNTALINSLMGKEADIPLEILGRKGEGFIQTYSTTWGIVQFHLGGPGIPPFAEAEARAIMLKTETGLQVRAMCLDDLIRAKEAAGRPQDLTDAAYLREKKSVHKKPQR